VISKTFQDWASVPSSAANTPFAIANDGPFEQTQPQTFPGVCSQHLRALTPPPWLPPSISWDPRCHGEKTTLLDEALHVDDDEM
jgi:hypothetical protein